MKKINKYHIIIIIFILIVCIFLGWRYFKNNKKLLDKCPIQFYNGSELLICDWIVGDTNTQIFEFKQLTVFLNNDNFNIVYSDKSIKVYDNIFIGTQINQPDEFIDYQNQMITFFKRVDNTETYKKYQMVYNKSTKKFDAEKFIEDITP